MLIISFTGMRFSAEIIIMAIRWYISYQLSYRDVQEMLGEQGVIVNHSSVFRWVMKYVPRPEKRFREHTKPVGQSWRMDETYGRVGGEDKYLYRAVDKEGNTVEFFLAVRRNPKAARRHLRKAMKTNERPRKINIDKSAASTAAINAHNKASCCCVTTAASQRRTSDSAGVASHSAWVWPRRQSDPPITDLARCGCVRAHHLASGRLRSSWSRRKHTWRKRLCITP